MTDSLGRTTSLPLYYEPGAVVNSPPKGLAGKASPVEFDFTQYLASVAQSLGGKADGSIGSPNPSAPEIGIPLHDEAYEESIAELLNASITNNGIATSLNSLKASTAKVEEQAARSKAKYDESIRLAEKAEKRKSGFLNKFLGVLSKVGAFAGALAGLAVAAVMIAGSGGLAAGPAILLGLGAIGSLVSLASLISQESGGPALDAGSLARAVADKLGGLANSQMIIGALGMLTLDPASAGQLVSGIAMKAGTGEATAAIVAGVVSAVAGIVLSFATGKVVGNAAKAAKLKELDKLEDATKLSGGLDKGAKGVDATEDSTRVLKFSERMKAQAESAGGQAVKKYGQLLEAKASITQGSTMSAKGSLDIETAEIERESDKVLADKQLTDTGLMRLRQSMNEERELVEKYGELLQSIGRSVSDILSNAGQSRSDINSTLSRVGA